jgi:hypothetical protein
MLTHCRGSILFRITLQMQVICVALCGKTGHPCSLLLPGLFGSQETVKSSIMCVLSMKPNGARLLGFDRPMGS